MEQTGDRQREQSGRRDAAAPAAPLLDLAQTLLERADHFHAHDAAMRGLAEAPDDRRLQHLAVLSLVNAGSLGGAHSLFADLGLDRWLLASTPLEDRLDLDIAALGARLLKEEARRRPSAARFLAAAEAYDGIHARAPDPYPTINAATLYRLAGRRSRAAELAQAVLFSTALTGPAEDEYWRLATRVEAYLVLGEVDLALALEPAARAAVGQRWSDLATTRRQLALLLAGTGDAGRFGEALQPPQVAHFCGHIVSMDPLKRFPSSAVPGVQQMIGRHLDSKRFGFAYGALAAGSDILFAEAFLERGAELHVVLPFPAERFVETSVRAAGDAWVRRFWSCVERARTVQVVTEDTSLDDPRLYDYGSRLAMGLAVLRSQWLQTTAEQVAIWDGQPAAGPSGTAVDVATWRQTGRQQMIIPISAAGAQVANPPFGSTGHAVARHVLAMLFADVTGFSTLRDSQLPVFVERVLGALSAALERHNKSLLMSNTWGDGVFAVFEGAGQAAACALALQAEMEQLDLQQLGLPPGMRLRLSGHVGPVHRLRDPILRQMNYYGTHVSRAARIEPVTPPGSVYVSENFAAALALEPGGPYLCEYVGVVSAAKSFGEMRMFLLRAA